MAEKVNYYELLGVARNAGADEIRVAIKKQRTIWSNRASRGGTVGAEAQNKVKLIGEAEKTLLDDAARAAYDQSLNDKPETSYVKPGEKDWLQVAYRYWDERDWEMAVEAVKHAVSQQQDNPEAWYLAAEIYTQIDDWDHVEEAAKQLALLDPDNPKSYLFRSVVYSNKGENEKDREMLNKVLRLCQSRPGSDGTRKLAQEQLAILDAAEYLKGEYAVLDKMMEEAEKLGGGDSYSYTKQCKEALDKLIYHGKQTLHHFDGIFADIHDPAPATQQFITEQRKKVSDVIDHANAFLSEESEQIKKAWIANAVALGIGFVVSLFLGAVGLILGAVVVGGFLVWVLGTPRNVKDGVPEYGSGMAREMGLGSGTVVPIQCIDIFLVVMYVFFRIQMGGM